MEAEMEPQGTQNLKKSLKASTQKNIKNTTLQKVGYCLHLGSKRDYFLAAETLPKSHQSHKS